MYPPLLAIHSLVRWLVLASLIFAIYRTYFGWKHHKKFTKLDDQIRHITATIAQVQLLLGLWLYAISPIVAFFLANFKEAIHLRQVRFFGMEHITVMLSAVIVISIGSIKAKRKTTDNEKFRTIYVWFGIGLLLILSSIPWSFSPLISRPLFRAF